MKGGMRTHDLCGNGLGIVLAITIVTTCRVPFGLRIHVGAIQLTTIRCFAFPSGMEGYIQDSDDLGPHRSY